MNNPKFTFLLPAYKAKFFEEALTSIKQQTYKDFKVIVSDDCSPEDLKSIFNRSVGEDPRFMFRRNTENIGGKSLVAHWNLLVDMCDTEYLIMASDDDVYEPAFLEEADKLLLKYPNVNLLRGRTRCIDSNGIIICKEDIKEEWMDNIHFIHRIYQSDWIGGIASFIYKTQYLNYVGQFIDFPLAWFSDEATNILMSNNGCCITNDIIFNVRNSSIQISSQWGDPNDAKKKVQATYMDYNWMKIYMHKFSNYVDSVFLKEIKEHYYKKIYSNIQSYIYHCYIKDFINLLPKCPNDIGLSKHRIIMHYLHNKLHI